ncbi:ESCRT-related protein CHMP1A-like [Papaver somniferum]|uniref:ESCRT-related protein CHMP1A-like n=1 Tax=Papaver somniferum TaxID=3469 RepID=UPI000E700CC0|nr:ESCRT-related protein CHMP1A-like [Papaver somniferum]
MESKTKALISLSENLRNLADECEKAIEPEKRKLKEAIQKGDTKQTEKHTKNMVGIRHEAVNFRQIANRIDSMVDYFENEPEQSTAFGSIPAIVESVNSALATGNPKKLLKAMNKIEKQYFDKEVVAKFKSSAATESTPTFMSEDEKPHNWFDIFKVKNLVFL